MTESEAVEKLNAIEPGDQEAAHSEADDILLAVVPESVKAAWWAAHKRCGGFWYA